MKMYAVIFLLLAWLGIGSACTSQYAEPKLLRHATEAEEARMQAFFTAFQDQWDKSHSNQWVFEDLKESAYRLKQRNVNRSYYGVNPESNALCLKFELPDDVKVADLLTAISAAYDASAVDDLDLVVYRWTSNSHQVVLARVFLSRSPAANRPHPWNKTEWFGEPAPSNNNPSSYF